MLNSRTHALGRRELGAMMLALPVAAVAGVVAVGATESFGTLKVVWVALVVVAAVLAARSLRATVATTLVALAFPFSSTALSGARLHTTYAVLAVLVVQLLVALSLSGVSFPRPLASPLVLIMGGGLVASVAGPDVGGSLARLAGGVVPALAAAVATAVVVRCERELRLLVTVAMVALAGVCLLALAQAAGAAPGPLASLFGAHRVNGLFEHPNDLGAYLAAMMLLLVGVFAVARRDLPAASGLVLVPIVAVALVALAATLSRGALLGLVAGALALLALLAMRGSATIVVAVLACTALGVFVLTPAVPESQRVAYAQRFAQLTRPGSEQGRALIYSEAQRAISEYPLTGVGPLTFGELLAGRTQLPLLQEGLGHAHDLLLEGYLSLGPLGLAGLLWLIAGACRRFVAIVRDRSAPLLTAGWAVGALAAIVATLTQSIGDFLFHQEELLVLFAMVLGSAYGLAGRVAGETSA